MRLLFDQNLSPRLKETLRGIYPESLHLRDIGLESADDVVVWAYARDHEFVIVSKDSDFLAIELRIRTSAKSHLDSARELLDLGD